MAIRTKSIRDLARVVDRRLKRDGEVSPGIASLTRLFEVSTLQVSKQKKVERYRYGFHLSTLVIMTLIDLPPQGLIDGKSVSSPVDCLSMSRP